MVHLHRQWRYVGVAQERSDEQLIQGTKPRLKVFQKPERLFGSVYFQTKVRVYIGHQRLRQARYSLVYLFLAVPIPATMGSRVLADLLCPIWFFFHAENSISRDLG